jgi:hypothetical protein
MWHLPWGTPHLRSKAYALDNLKKNFVILTAVAINSFQSLYLDHVQKAGKKKSDSPIQFRHFCLSLSRNITLDVSVHHLICDETKQFCNTLPLEIHSSHSQVICAEQTLYLFMLILISLLKKHVCFLKHCFRIKQQSAASL